MLKVYYEFEDGSGAHITCESDERARAEADQFIGEPVRVWIGIEMVQEGFVRADEREE